MSCEGPLLNREHSQRFDTVQGASEKSSPLKLFGIFSLRLSIFCVKFCKLVGSSYPHNYIHQFL